MRRMRVVHIEAGRHLYGGAVQVRHLVSGLASAGVDNVLVCARGGELAAAAPEQAQTVALPMRGDLDVALVPRLLRVIRDVSADLVHVHSRRGADLYGGLAASIAGVPAILTRRVDSIEPAWLGRIRYRPFEAVVALSAVIENQLRAGGCRSERIARIPSAVDVERLRPDDAARARVCTAFGLPDDALVIGVVAQLIERKRHAWLFAALADLVAEQPRLRVLCFGRGPLEQSLRADLEARGLLRFVQLAGFRRDLAQLMPGLDLLVHPAAREGLGVALLEAASAGVPVVACAAGGIPDVVENGRTGLLVPVDDRGAFAAAIRRLLEDSRERAKLGAAARARAEQRFAVPKLVSAHLSLYERVLRTRATTLTRPAVR